MPIAVALALSMLSTPCTPANHPWIAEVLYDAAGDDTGREFVELYYPGPGAFPLEGMKLEVGDGSAAGRWSVRWTGGPGHAIAAGARFVIGGALLSPAPDAVATLELQNGPDAVRITWPDGASEVLGYGALEFPEYFCGAPATDAAAGQSLARWPDEANGGSNALDFRAAPPTPSRANAARLDAAIVPGSLRAVPAPAAPFAPLALAARVANRGRDGVAPGAVALEFSARGDGGTVALASATLAEALAPGDETDVAAEGLAPAAGLWTLLVRARLAADEVAGDDLDSLRVRIGPGPLRLREIQFHPANGEGEWIEVENAGEPPLDPADFGVRDRSGTTAAAAPGGTTLAPGSLGVLAQDRRALLAARPRLDSTRVWSAAPWPSLNNGDVGGIADSVALVEPGGTASDAHAYSAAGVPRGAPIEWRDGGWWPSSVAGGTPLEPPRTIVVARGRFEIRPRLVAPAAARVTCRWSLPWPRARLSLEVFDLAGRSVGVTVPEFAAPASGEREVGLAALPPGLYAVTLRARDEGGPDQLAEVHAIRIAGPRR